MVIAYGLSFVGFSSLIDKLYPAMGVIGLVICAAIVVKYISRKSDNKNISHKIIEYVKLSSYMRK